MRRATLARMDWRRCPHVRPWVVIVGVDVVLDRGDQIGHGMKCPVLQRLIGQLAKPLFHQVDQEEEVGVNGVEPWMIVQPGGDVVVFVGGVVVQMRWIARSSGTSRSMVVRNSNHS